MKIRKNAYFNDHIYFRSNHLVPIISTLFFQDQDEWDCFSFNIVPLIIHLNIESPNLFCIQCDWQFHCMRFVFSHIYSMWLNCLVWNVIGLFYLWCMIDLALWTYCQLWLNCFICNSWLIELALWTYCQLWFNCCIYNSWLIELAIWTYCQLWLDCFICDVMIELALWTYCQLW